jgi:hypothetical protein
MPQAVYFQKKVTIFAGGKNEIGPTIDISKPTYHGPLGGMTKPRLRFPGTQTPVAQRNI